MIETGGEKGSGRSMIPMQHDDDYLLLNSTELKLQLKVKLKKNIHWVYLFLDCYIFIFLVIKFH